VTTAYPLKWPDGWPRTAPVLRKDGRGHFARGGGRVGARRVWTFAEARDKLLDELRQLGATQVVISSNFKQDRYGSGPIDDGKRRHDDQGIAVYFFLAGKQMAMARDAWERAEENMRSLTLAIEAMRQLDRHGGSTMMSRAFEGFTALPPPKSCWEILGITPTTKEDVIQSAFRSRAFDEHPDKGGNNIDMAELVRARDEALRQIHGNTV
jgi:hypothetical protein